MGAVTSRQTVWVDVACCTGCGACVEACPAGAVALVDGRARVDEEKCTGCRACVDACPEGAIQPVIQGELVLAPERPAPTVYRSGPLVEAVGVTVAVAGAGLVVKLGRGLAWAVDRWLARRSAATGPSLRQAHRHEYSRWQGKLPRQAQDAAVDATARGGGVAGRGRRARRRRRGR